MLMKRNIFWRLLIAPVKIVLLLCWFPFMFILVFAEEDEWAEGIMDNIQNWGNYK